ncbi:MAG: hypothetical protein HY711_01175 [Candidatus Melainabacteria bacterium]|nr:hypothetical protein [Candidatus Melainabacteria bacterium]
MLTSTTVFIVMALAGMVLSVVLSKLNCWGWFHNTAAGKVVCFAALVASLFLIFGCETMVLQGLGVFIFFLGLVTTSRRY